MHRAPGKLCREAIPFTTGARAAGIYGLEALAQILLALHNVTVDLRVERLCHLGRSAAEFHKTPSSGDRIHAKTMIPQPGGDGLDVLRGWTKLLAELPWGKPMVIAGRRRVLLRSQKRLKGLLLRRAPAEEQHHPLHCQIAIRGGDGHCGTESPIDMSLQFNELALVDPARNARIWHGLGCNGRNQRDRNQ